MILLAPEYHHLNEQHWKKGAMTSEKVKALANKQAPFSSSNDFTTDRQTSSRID
jgi:hypothetical protein